MNRFLNWFRKYEPRELDFRFKEVRELDETFEPVALEPNKNLKHSFRITLEKEDAYLLFDAAESHEMGPSAFTKKILLSYLRQQ